MADLTAFKQRVNELVAATSRARHWTRDEAERYMAKFGERHRQFDEVAGRLASAIIRPRLEALVQSFPNARMGKDDLAEGGSCWFGYCERYPVTARVEFAVEHDQRWEEVVVHSETYMMPVLVRYQEQDNLHFPFDAIDENAATEWVEERVFEFLDCYLQLDRGAPDLEEDMATDPVCGMRIGRSAAVGSADYRGRAYLFCSQDCLDKFRGEPTRFVQVEEI